MTVDYGMLLRPAHRPNPAPHRCEPSPLGRGCPCTAQSGPQATQPEWSAVALHDALLKLAQGMHDLAEELGRQDGDYGLLRYASGHTVAAADLVRIGQWNTATGLAWLDEGNAALARVKRVRG